MKKIQNKETSLLLTEDVKLTYVDLITITLDAPMTQGVTLKQMKQDLALLTKVESVKENDSVEFTDEEITKIKTSVENHLWAKRHVDLQEFGDYVDSL